MRTCALCGKSGFFLRLDENSLCSSCQKYFLNVIAPRCKQFFESYDIITESKNLETIHSRSKFALDVLHDINEKVDNKIDVISLITQQMKVIDGKNMTTQMGIDLSEKYFQYSDFICRGLEKSILETAYHDGSTTKARAKKDFLTAFEKFGQSFDSDRWDLDKSLISIFKRLEYENKIEKRKEGGHYEYFLGNVFTNEV